MTRILVGMTVLLAACGGNTTGGAESGTGGSPSAGGMAMASGGLAGGAGGANPSTGGHATSTGGVAAVLTDCKNPLPSGAPCSQPSAHCGGPCSNSWQADNVCKDGMWQLSDVVPCGPNASSAPQCHNGFSGGALTPCCAAGKLDCTGKPDGYPGFGCTPGDNSFCSCTCAGGVPLCGC